jgi:hypothetical protein
MIMRQNRTDQNENRLNLPRGQSDQIKQDRYIKKCFIIIIIIIIIMK